MMSEWSLEAVSVGDKAKPTLVLLHSLGSSVSMWDECIPELVKDFYVLLVNLPGHGGSSVAPIGFHLSGDSSGKMTMPILLDALDRTLDAFSVGRFHCAGLSIGGMVACAVAQRWGSDPVNNRVLSVTVMASGPVNGQPKMWQDRASLIRSQGTAAVVDATMERWFSEGFSCEFPEAVQRIRQIFLACDPQGYAQCCEVLETSDLRLSMADVRVPVAVVNGSQDAGFDDQQASALAAMCVNAPWVGVFHVEGARHMCAMESPEYAVEAIMAAYRESVSSHIEHMYDSL